MDSKEKKLRELVKPVINLLKKTNIRAEELTLFRVLSGIIVAFFLFSGIYTYSLVAILIYQFILLLDYVDGPIARFRNEYKIKWFYFDYMTHYILAVLFLLAITFSVYYSSESILMLILGFSASLALLFTSIFDKKAFFAVRFNKLFHKKEKTGLFSEIKSFIKIEAPFSLFFFLIVFDLKQVLIVTYFVIYIVGMFYKLFSNFYSLKNG